MGGGLLVVLVVASRLVPLREWMSGFTDWIKDHGVWGVVLFMASYVAGAVFFLPASLFTLAAGIAFGFRLGVPVVMVSAAMGAAASFLISRHLARGLVEKRLLQNEKLKAFDVVVEQEGWKVVLLLRLVPLFPFPVGNYFFGLTKVRFWPFLAATLVGVMPGSTLYVYLGYIGKMTFGEKHPPTMQEWILRGLGLLATIIVIAYITQLARKALREMESKARPKQRTP